MNYSVLCIFNYERGLVERLGWLLMIVVVAMLKWTLKTATAATKKMKLANSNMVAGLPQTFSLRMYYLLGMQPGNCHGDYLILVDCERLYLRSHTKLVSDPIFSPVDMAAVKYRRVTKFGV